MVLPGTPMALGAQSSPRCSEYIEMDGSMFWSRKRNSRETSGPGMRRWNTWKGSMAATTRRLSMTVPSSSTTPRT